MPQELIECKIWRRVGRLVAVVALLTACTPPDPVRIGFIGGLSGRVADLGINGRNGATLAVKLRNKSGCVKGPRECAQTAGGAGGRKSQCGRDPASVRWARRPGKEHTA